MEAWPDPASGRTRMAEVREGCRAGNRGIVGTSTIVIGLNLEDIPYFHALLS